MAEDTPDARTVARNLPPVTLGSAQGFILLAGLTTVFTVMALVLYPWAYQQWIKEVGIRSFEGPYGFRTGLVERRWPGQDAEHVWGIVSVDPGGHFARAGVRDGDIPFDQHDEILALYGALDLARAGQPSSFEVFNATDTHLGVGARRVVQLPPMPLR
jgi:hypothetical protein